MPLTKEGEVLVSRRQRQDDLKFISRYGVDRFREKLESLGVYAYGFANKKDIKSAIDLMLELSERYLWIEDHKLRDKYFGPTGHHSWFNYRLYYSKTSGFPEVLIIDKPFPKTDFDGDLRKGSINFFEFSVYRLGDLKEDQIRNQMRGGVLFNRTESFYVDLEGSISS